MKKIFAFAVIAMAAMVSLTGCAEDNRVYPSDLTTATGYCWYGESDGTKATMLINGGTAILTVWSKTSQPTDYTFTFVYDKSSGNASVINQETVGSISGNMIVPQGKEKTYLSAKFNQLISQGDIIIFQGVMNYQVIVDSPAIAGGNYM